MKTRKTKISRRIKARTGFRVTHFAVALVALGVACVGLGLEQRSNAQSIAESQPAATVKTAKTDYALKAAASMQAYYAKRSYGQGWNGWWASANSLTALIDYMELSGSREYMYVIDQVHTKNKGGKFINDFYDDMAWWGLAWLRAYDLTKDPKYLESSKYIADYMYNKGWDKKCGGGVYWKKQEGKFAVENELFIKLTAGIHNRSPSDTKYLGLGKKGWDWFVKSGMINSQNMINDGLDNKSCKNNKGVTWTYNQGTILGAAVEMYKATSDKKYLTKATQLANASMADLSKGNNGVVKEKTAEACGKCTTGNETVFKGVYARNLRELGKVTKSVKIDEFLSKNAVSAWNKGRGKYDIVGFHWQGPYDRASAANQQSALDLFNSQIKKKLPPNQAKGKTATSDASCSAKESASAAIDGTAKTKWCAKMSASTEGANLTVDLGSLKTVKRFRVLHASAGAEKTKWNTRDFEILTSQSASGPWKQVAKVGNNDSGGTVHAIKPTKAQYVRLHITNPGEDKVARIYEFAVE